MERGRGARDRAPARAPARPGLTPPPAPAARARLDLSIGPTDRIYIAGMSRSGKSTLATRILNAWDAVFIDDSKGGDPATILPNAKLTGDWREAIKALPGRVIYQPPRHEMREHPKKVAAIVERIWALGGHHAIGLHELNDVVDETTRLDNPIIEVWRKGGLELFSIPIVAMSQRPKKIPLVARTESTIVVTFALIDRDDVDTMASIMGDAVREHPLALPFDRSFYVRDQMGLLSLIRGGVKP